MSGKEQRIQGDLKVLDKERCNWYQAILDDDRSTFYFMFRGQEDTKYRGGYYIGKIETSPNYPQTAVDYTMFTPSGRFQINNHICLTNSMFHVNDNSKTYSWNPNWSVHKMIEGLVLSFHGEKDSGISHIRISPSYSESRKKEMWNTREKHAKNSLNYNRENHLDLFLKFDQLVNPDGSVKTDEEIKQFIKEKKKARKKAKKEARKMRRVQRNKSS